MPSILTRYRPLLGAARCVLLGAFVLGQVVYLAASLLCNGEEAFRPPVEVRWLRAWNEREVNGIRQYGQATAQRQRWQLFAPETWKESRFLELTFLWDEPAAESVTLRAICQPDDLNAFVHVGGFRIRKYEDTITPEPPPPSLTVLFGDEDDLEPNEILAEVAYPDKAEKMAAYLRWRLAAYRRAHPDRPPPRAVQLWLHTYALPEPPGPDPWRWEDRKSVYVGRWLP